MSADMTFSSLDRTEFSSDEIMRLMFELQCVFSVVRLVDADACMQYTFGKTGALVPSPYRCYAVWRRAQRCDNCVTQRALRQRKQLAKFDFVGDDLYYIIAKYLVVDGTPCVMELVSLINEDVLIDGWGKQEIIESISLHNKRMYQDPLTGVRNRLYYEERLSGREGMQAVVMLDLDGFKHVNDTYGHTIGDLVLKTFAQTVQSCVSPQDELTRLGGDEFVLVFRSFEPETLQSKLDHIREQVSTITFAQAPGLHITASIGCAYGDASVSSLMSYADALLYEAKEQRNDVRIRHLL